MVFLGLEEAGRNVLITLLKEGMSLGQGLSCFCKEALVNLTASSLVIAVN